MGIPKTKSLSTMAKAGAMLFGMFVLFVVFVIFVSVTCGEDAGQAVVQVAGETAVEIGAEIGHAAIDIAHEAILWIVVGAEVTAAEGKRSPAESSDGRRRFPRPCRICGRQFEEQPTES